jgi:hypothetical protein
MDYSEYKVVFEKRNGFRLFGKGTIRLEQENVTFVGNRSWPYNLSTISQIFIFILVLILFQIDLINNPITAIVQMLIALVVASAGSQLFFKSSASISVEKSSISDIARNKRKISFNVQPPKSQKSEKSKKSILKFQTESEEQGLEVETYFGNL